MKDDMNIEIVSEGYSDDTFKTLTRNPCTPLLATERKVPGKVGRESMARTYWAWNPTLTFRAGQVIAGRWYHVREADLTSCGYTFKTASEVL